MTVDVDVLLDFFRERGVCCAVLACVLLLLVRLTGRRRTYRLVLHKRRPGQVAAGSVDKPVDKL